MADKLGNIRDVARESGLSTATVSRVMNGNPKVNPELRAQVLKAAERLNYVPNPAARALSTAKSKTVAAIIPTIEHSVYAKYITSVEQTLGQLGYTFVLAISNADQNQELAAAEKLIAMGAEAFILTGAEHSPDLIELLKRRVKPVVFTSVFDVSSEIPTIGYDNENLGLQAFDYLKRCGHREIAIVHGPQDKNDRTVARRKGVVDAIGPSDTVGFIEVELSVGGGREAAQRALASEVRPTAVLCFSDVLAQGVMFHLQSVGLKIPDDISIMGFDNLDWSTASHPSLTTIDLPATKMGVEAAQSVILKLEENKSIESVQLTAEIVVRDSVKARQ